MIRTYLPGLNTLRLYAALSVVLVHVLPREQWGFLPIMAGGVAVTLFFVLSGYLITLLLLYERDDTGTVNVGHFLRRRARRIWPLYYTITLLAYLLPLGIQPWTLPITLVFGVAVLHVLPTLPANGIANFWSISVEEVFYLFWPQMVRRWGVLGPVAAILLGRWVLDTVMPHQGQDGLPQLLAMLRFECMAVGAAIAWAHHQRGQWYRVLTHRAVAGGAVVAFVLLSMTLHTDWETFTGWVVQSLIFGIVLLNVTVAPWLAWVERPWLSWWGQRTYGIYMWHFPLIALLRVMVPTISTLALLIWTLALTALLAVMSYRYIERPFLNTRRQRKEAA